MGSGFSFLFPPLLLSDSVGCCLACSVPLFPNLVCLFHLSVHGMLWPWFGSASPSFLTDLGQIPTTLPLIQARIFCPASGLAGQTYFPGCAQAS